VVVLEELPAAQTTDVVFPVSWRHFRRKVDFFTMELLFQVVTKVKRRSENEEQAVLSIQKLTYNRRFFTDSLQISGADWTSPGLCPQKRITALATAVS
jgi:hypothetical protein